MRPVAIKQGELRTPLNQILGRESHVRILRILTTSDSPMLRSELAVCAGLDLSGLRRSVAKLIETGIVERVGRQPLVQLARKHPLAQLIRSLFAEERKPYDRCIALLRDAAAQIGRQAYAVWIEGKFGLDCDRKGDPFEIGLDPHIRRIHNAEAGGSTRDEYEREARLHLQEFERVAGMRPTVRAWMAADFVQLSRDGMKDLRRAISLCGTPPIVFAYGAKRRAEALSLLHTGRSMGIAQA